MAKNSKKGKVFRTPSSNYTARIKSAPLAQTNGFRTQTVNRDAGTMNVSVVTRDIGGTTCKIFTDNYLLNLNGYEARTLWRTLSKHFESK